MRERAGSVLEKEFLVELREATPFLREIPDEVYFRLDSSEFYFPVGKIAQVRNDLEQRLGYYVMTYKADVFNLAVPVERHLCANLKGAELTTNQLLVMNDYERIVRSKGVSLVVYQELGENLTKL